MKAEQLKLKFEGQTIYLEIIFLSEHYYIYIGNDNRSLDNLSLIMTSKFGPKHLHREIFGSLNYDLDDQVRIEGLLNFLAQRLAVPVFLSFSVQKLDALQLENLLYIVKKELQSFFGI